MIVPPLVYAGLVLFVFTVIPVIGVNPSPAASGSSRSVTSSIVYTKLPSLVMSAAHLESLISSAPFGSVLFCASWSVFSSNAY